MGANDFNSGAGAPRQTARDGAREAERDSLWDMDHLADEDAIWHGEPSDIGDSGEEDDKYGGAAALKELKAKPPARARSLLRRVAECAKALRQLRASRSQSWPRDREPDDRWRAMADEALGIIGETARRELDEQRVAHSMPEDERESFQMLCDSRRALAVFRDGFAREREAWEQAYWKRALDESFGKRAWSGPSGWRSLR
jgi:hypothetical protein